MMHAARFGWAGTTVVVIALSGCSSLIGVEGPTEGSSGGAGPSGGGNTASSGARRGDGASAGDAGSTSTGDGGKRSGAGGVPDASGGAGDASGGAGDHSGGAGSSSGGLTGMGTGGNGGEASGGLAGSGASSATGGGSATLSGRVVDLFGKPLSHTQVTVTGGLAALTDDGGNFTIEDAPETYDAQIRFSARGSYYLRAYRFIGLTRRDPTLQVEVDVGDQEALVSLKMGDLPSPPTPQVGDLSAAVGDPIAAILTGDESGTSSSVAMDYDGQDPFATTVHALFWKDAGDATEFYGISSQTISVTDGELTEVSLNNWTALPSTLELAGRITAPGSSPEVEVTAYCNFNDGASIPLQTVPWSAADGTFSLTAPDLGSLATFSVAACVSNLGDACAHADDIPLDSSAQTIELAIPGQPLLQTPPDGAADVTADTVFSWTPSDEGPCSLVLINNAYWIHGLRVITCDSQLTVSSEFLGDFFYPGEKIYVSVQSHGKQTSTDEMSGPTGFVDPYYFSTSLARYPRGTNRPRKGTFARSETRIIRFAQ